MLEKLEKLARFVPRTACTWSQSLGFLRFSRRLLLRPHEDGSGPSVAKVEAPSCALGSEMTTCGHARKRGKEKKVEWG